MPGPSNYRYEPFSDISSGVTLTERHLIPATSPYIVRLNEVPQKNSPSTMTVKEITDVNGETTSYGSTFDEVAANPSANQFWPDYNTGADGNDNWNTGLLQFNSADAGKLIEVSYTGTGTLASVQANRYPAWWLDRGDGSDGDIVVSVDDKWEETQLAAACNASTTALTVDNNENINEGMTLQIDNEKMLVTAIREPNLVHVTRAQNGSAAASHSNDAVVYIVGKK